MPAFKPKRERRIANAVIADPEQRTSMAPDGAARSVQAAEVDMPQEQLDSIWSDLYLERLARTYWWYLSRISLGLIRVHYGVAERAIVLIGRPLVLLRFHPPHYELTDDRAAVRWDIRDGLLVARSDDGYLGIDVRRGPAREPGYAHAHIEVEVANFYPRLARPFRWLYVNTQSRVHVLVTHGFLRHLARLELRESAIGHFSGDTRPVAPGPADPRSEEQLVGEDATVGDAPWGAIAGLVAVWALLVGLLAWAWRARQ